LSAGTDRVTLAGRHGGRDRHPPLVSLRRPQAWPSVTPMSAVRTNVRCMDEVVVTADEVRAFRARLVETSCSDANPAELVELLDELEVVKNVVSGLQARGGRAGSGPPRGGGRTGRPGRPAWQRGC